MGYAIYVLKEKLEQLENGEKSKHTEKIEQLRLAISILQSQK